MAARNINHAEFKALLQEGKTVLVDYWAPWCGYCRRISPAYERIAQEYGQQFVVAKVNIDEEPLLAEQERIEVIPTLVLYQNGKVVGSVIAPESKARIDGLIAESLQK